MGKVLALGDTHGRSNWKMIVNDTFDKIVFIGDYLDSHGGTTGQEQLDNFKDIIEYKKANMDRVVLLFGNHDFHYTDACNGQYSGFQRKYYKQFHDVLANALEGGLMQMVYVSGKLMFSHAGVTKTWCLEKHVNTENVEKSVNDLFKNNLGYFNFSGYDSYGDDITQSPIWVRPSSLFTDKLEQFTQVVGHTTVTHINITDTGIILIDALGTSGEYLIVEDDKITIAK